jgi:hypothetical protein
VTSGDFIIWNSPYRGLVWDNEMISPVGGGNCNSTTSFIRVKNDSLSAVWTEAPYYGMADTNGNNNLYIEDNRLENVMEGIDIDSNSRAVIRHNNLVNTQVLNHGADTGPIAGRYLDIGYNLFEWDSDPACGGNPAGVNFMIVLRGAPALIHDNTIPDVTSMTWGDKKEVRFYDEKLRRNAVTGWPCWTGGYPSPYQVGWGYSAACPGGCTQAGSTGIYMILEPVYLWNNTGAGNYGAPTIEDYPNECGGGAPLVSTFIQVNREYYLSTAKPGYTSYTYPHPLQGEGGDEISSGQINGTLRLRH